MLELQILEFINFTDFYIYIKSDYMSAVEINVAN